jgi:hypothetical protein
MQLKTDAIQTRGFRLAHAPVSARNMGLLGMTSLELRVSWSSSKNRKFRA